MTQGAENDLVDIRLFTEDQAVYFLGDNNAFTDLNTNILIVDNKAILARNTAQATETSLTTHIGSVGIAEHTGATTTNPGFFTAADKAKLDSVQENAQINALPPSDALELTTGGDTFLHLHPEATSISNGFISALDKIKLDGIEAGAGVNPISDTDATTLTDGSNADLLHLHSFSLPTETFILADHTGTDHTGIDGTAGFSPFNTSETYFEGVVQSGPGVTVFTHTYSFAPQTLTADWSYYLAVNTTQSNLEVIRTNSVSVVGNDGIVTYEIDNPQGSLADIDLKCYQGAFG